MMQTVDALRMCIFSSVQRVSVVLGEYHIRVRLLHVCSFNYDGQFQGLYAWSEQQGKALTHSFFIPNAKAESPAATITNMRQKIRLALDARLLSTNEVALKKVIAILTELEEQGFIENGQIVFDDSDTEKVNRIFDKGLENEK